MTGLGISVTWLWSEDLAARELNFSSAVQGAGCQPWTRWSFTHASQSSTHTEHLNKISLYQPGRQKIPQTKLCIRDWPGEQLTNLKSQCPSVNLSIYKKWSSPCEKLRLILILCNFHHVVTTFHMMTLKAQTCLEKAFLVLLNRRLTV